MNKIKFSQKVIGINPTKSGELSLYLQVFINSERDRIPLELRVKKNEFDKLKGVCTAKTEAAKDLNLTLESYKARASDIIVAFRLNGQDITLEKFRKEMSNPIDRNCFIEFMAGAINKRKPLVSKETSGYLFTICNTVREFTARLPFANLDVLWLQDYEIWLTRKKRYSINTRAKHFKKIRQFVRLAIKEGLINRNPFDYFKVESAKGNMVALSLDELKAIAGMHADSKTADEIRNMLQYYLFSCYTGLRYVDIKLLNRKNIYGNMLILLQEKVKRKKLTEHKIPLIPEAMRYLNTKGSLFNQVYSAAHTNRLLKLVADDLSIFKKLTFHTSRHTCGTLLATFGLAPQYIKEYMGHSKIEQSMDYVHLSRKDLVENMAIISQKLRDSA